MKNATKKDIDHALEVLGFDAIVEEDVYDRTGLTIILLDSRRYWMFDKDGNQVCKLELTNDEYDYAEEVWGI